MGRTITKGELVALLANISDDTPLIVYNEAIADYMNLSLTAEDVREQVVEEMVAIAITATDDYDTRQW
jgi:hypothetical protein